MLTMELWTAFILGLAGSVHCAGMCGPLALALPRAEGGTWSHIVGRIAYNLGRVTTYGLLGLVFGLAGRSLALAGVQQWVSIGLGALLLVGVLAARTDLFRLPGVTTGAWWSTAMSRLLRQRGLAALGLLGALNGLLPCGLVYVAGLAGAALGDFRAAIEYMLVFGLGTVPVMLGLSLAGTALQAPLRLRLQRAIPYGLGLVAVLLIFRGLGLGIPYLSPDLAAPDGRPVHCH
jgi:uncharacterized protein